ncbi:hypothetical protein COCOBI_02-8530 [Coccomyxa sp. Obi]|nr:hypothetical protein COCOBI_02-8530 [Coccomyxa sp. Obi]
MVAILLLAAFLCSFEVATAAEAGLGLNDLKAIIETSIEGDLEHKSAKVQRIMDKKFGKKTITMNAASATPTPTIPSTGAQSTGAPPTTAQPQTTTAGGTTIKPPQTTAAGGTTAQPQTTVRPSTSTVLPTTNPPTTPSTLSGCAALSHRTCNTTTNTCPNPTTASVPPYCGCPQLPEIFIQGTAGPTDMSYYTCLQSIVAMGDISLNSIASLKSLAGLQSLTTVEGFIELYNLTLLTSIDSSTLPALKTVGRIPPTLLGAGIEILSDAALTSVSGFQALESTDALDISACDVLISISGFSALRLIGTISIASNPLLTSIPDFPALTSAGYIQISDNPSLTAITGFLSLTSITNIPPEIIRNTKLTDISGLSTLAHAYNCTADTHGGMPITGVNVEVYPNGPSSPCVLDTYAKICAYIRGGKLAVMC